MRYLLYNEQHEDGDKLIRVSVEEAVATQRSRAYSVRQYVYQSDEEALLDFIAVNWARYEDEAPIGIYTPFTPMQVTNIFNKKD